MKRDRRDVPFCPASVKLHIYSLPLHKPKAGQAGRPALSHPLSVHTYARNLHKPNGTESGTDQGRDKAGQHPVPASAAAVFSRSGQAGQTPVFQTRRGSTAPLV
ncbi:hypothetical protein EE09_18 [Escherichia phage vB_EcoS-EE09]|nr:hypothetical protein EE09_18 [Escherichia phage vB_EcoS-EE09]